MKFSKILIFVIPIVIFIVFVLGMIMWINKKSPNENSASTTNTTPTPTFSVVPTISVRKTSSLLNQIKAFDPLETSFAPPVFEKIPELPKE